MENVISVRLSHLRDGSEYPGGTINARTHTFDEVRELADSIAEKGLLQSLLVMPGPEGDPGYYAIAGGRRRRALMLIAEAGTHPLINLEFDVPVICRSDLSPAQALALSIEENDPRVRVPMHDVERYRAFATLAERNATPAEIAGKFRTTEKVVEQALALGRLDDSVLDAWLAKEIGERDAQIFTLSSSKKHQARVLKDLRKAGRLRHYGAIRQALVGKDDEAAAKLVNFVGVAEYEAAGGKINRDLFGKNHHVGDAALAKQLADQKLEKIRAQLLAEGWSWVLTEQEAPQTWRAWPRANTPKPKLTDEQEARGRVINERFGPKVRKTAGCVIGISLQGELECWAGITRPQDKKKAAADAPKGKEAPSAQPISAALAHRLSCQLTKAIASTIAEDDGKLAGAALVAALSSYDGPIALTSSGMDGSDRREHFAAIFEAQLKGPAESLRAAIAAAIAQALDLRTHNPGSTQQSKPGAQALIAALPADAVNRHLVGEFDAQDYFKSAPQRLVLQAIKEADPVGAATLVASKAKGGTIREYAIKNVPNTDWLPPEMRTKHYSLTKIGSKDAPAKAAKKGNRAQPRKRK